MYQRNPVLTDPARYMVMCLCWEPGQRSPVHNHRGSSCAVVVLNGVCSETIYEPDPAHEGYWRVQSGPHDLGEGGVVASVDTDTHVVENRQAEGVGLCTLHIYCPPLTKMDIYESWGAEKGDAKAGTREAVRPGVWDVTKCGQPGF